MISFAALIPFVLLLVCFVGLRIPLTISSVIALISGSLLTQSIFNGSSEVWNVALSRTFQITIEIGLILFGAFFFLEVAKKMEIIQSLAKLIQEVSSNRVVQVILVTFPLELLVEGSSGFGTPLLIIAPILLAMGIAPILCAILPFINCVIGIPFGALGTPIRLGFANAGDPTFGTFILLLPILLMAPLLSAFVATRSIRPREILWILFVSSFYGICAFWISKSGPEFATLIPAFLTFIMGIVSSRIIFPEAAQEKMRDLKGIKVYGILLASMWIGKQIFMDRLIPGTHLRIFNPGFVFILFGFILISMGKGAHPIAVFKSTVERSKRTLLVFFCMTFVVQQMRENGGLGLLTESIPQFLRGTGAPILGWLGTLFVGTSTVSNLLISKVTDPVRFSAVAAGSSVGVMLAFQSLAAMRSALNNQVTEKELYLRIAPLSVCFIFLITAFYQLILAFHFN